jgi:hypothetical protein
MSIYKFLCQICRTVGVSDPSLNRTMYTVLEIRVLLNPVCEQGKKPDRFSPLTFAWVVTHCTEWQLAIKKNRKGVNDRSSCTSYFNRWLVTYCTVVSISVYSFKQTKLGYLPKSLSALQSVHQLTDLHTQSHILIIWGEGSFEKICSLWLFINP